MNPSGSDQPWVWSAEHGDYYRRTQGPDGRVNFEWGRSHLSDDPDNQQHASQHQPAAHPPPPPQPQQQQLPQPHTYQSSGPISTMNPPYNPAQPQTSTPTRSAPAHQQPPGYYQSPQYPHQAPAYAQSSHTQAPSQQPYPYQTHQGVSPYPPATPSRAPPPNPGSSPATQSDSTQSPPYPNTHPYSWTHNPRPGQ